MLGSDEELREGRLILVGHFESDQPSGGDQETFLTSDGEQVALAVTQVATSESGEGQETLIGGTVSEDD